MTIVNPYAWAVGTVDEKTGEFHVMWISVTRREARNVRIHPWEVIRKVFIQPAEAVKRSR